MPLPKRLHGAAAKKVVGMMVARGFLEEVAANIRKRGPFWREDGEGQASRALRGQNAGNLCCKVAGAKNSIRIPQKISETTWLSEASCDRQTSLIRRYDEGSW